MLLPSLCLGHAFNPSLLELREQAGGQVEVLWKDAGSPRALAPVLPRRCHDAGPALPAGEGVVVRRTLQCGPEGLRGATVAVRGLDLPGDEVLARVVLNDGRTLSAVLRGDAPELHVPDRAGGRAVARGYVGLGIRHILGGYDHLLFVLALLLLVPGPRRLLLTVSAFTAAHSLTLSLATLGLARVPQPPVEAAIALSIVLLAAELCREDEATWTARRPWLVALAFGLLHGLGFAGALGEAGLPEGEVPLALLGFNAGVEIGQVLFVAAALLAGAVLRHLRAVCVPGPPGHRPRRVIAYGIGSLAAFWCFQRVAAFWGP